MSVRHSLIAVLMLLAGLPAEPLPTVRANGMSLHYLDRGKGEPIVFVHGALADYRE